MKYTRFLVGFLALLCVISFQVVPQVQAKPLTTFCSGVPCSSDWGVNAGDNHGMAATLSDPTATTVQSGNLIDVELDECDSATCGNIIAIGVEFRGNSAPGGACSGSGSGSFYFYQFNTTFGCVSVPSGDHGHSVTFKMGFFTSGTGGMFFQVVGWTGQHFCAPSNACFINNAPQVWKGQEDYGSIGQAGSNNGWTTTQVPLRDFTDNQYQQDVSGTPWVYEHVDPSSFFNDKPPYSNWSPFPSVSTTGGDMFLCMEASNLAAC